jgi:hypothetical protein
MHKDDKERVVFYSKDDMMGPTQLGISESILRSPTKEHYTDINDVMELYNIKKYIDNQLYLQTWTQEDIANYKLNVVDYTRIIGQFMSCIDDSNINQFFDDLSQEYIQSFWEVVNNQSVFKRISNANFIGLLQSKPYLIHNILTHKNLVEYYNVEIRDFLLTYKSSAEILLSFYEVKAENNTAKKILPKSLTVQDKEIIISNYLDSNDTNLNYIGLIPNARNRPDFKLSDKLRLKAKRVQKRETEKFFTENGGMKYGISISYPRNAIRIKHGYLKDQVAHYEYSFDFIKQNFDPYLLFQNFRVLFEFLDKQSRINLVSKRSHLDIMERITGLQAQSEYKIGLVFNMAEMTSHAQIVSYSQILNELNISIEEVLRHAFTFAFQTKYTFANNVRIVAPSSTNSYFEKVRFLAPEFESILKQFKIFVEEGSIDFELLQISSAPSAIKDIPSLNKDKYAYLIDNTNAVGCSNLFFSDQTLLAYVEPFKEKRYRSFFDLLANEQVNSNNYESHQMQKVSYLVEKGYISIDSNGFVQIVNPERVMILHDLFNNEVASIHHYPANFRNEAVQMAKEGILSFESSLFSKPEQSYFNYFLNKSEFTNGLDLRNSYLHGTQADPNESEKHQYAYFTYLKLLTLVLLKIEDDLFISQMLKYEA